MFMKILAKILFSLSLIFIYSISSADLSTFEIELSKTTVWVWESVDLVIKAIDQDWNVYSDYVWDVLIFSSDDTAEFPSILSENIYTFEEWSNWIATFDSAVRFFEEWIQDINVFDFYDESIFWFAEIEVVDKNSVENEEEIVINSPESWTTIPTNSTRLSWTTKPNHQISIIINDDREITSMSNSSWVFETNLDNLQNWTQVIIAHILDSNDQIIWTSNEVVIEVNTNSPNYLSIKLSWYDEKSWIYNSQEVIDVEVSATPWLYKVQANLNWLIVDLIETANWLYIWNITTPRENWEYWINLTLVNDMWIETKENAVITLYVEEVELLTADDNDDIVEEIVVSQEVSCEDLQKWLEIKNINLTKLKTKSVLSWEKVEKATSYNVYKKDNSWEMTFVRKVSTPMIEINITWDDIVYEDFAIKAYNEGCWVESASFSEMTKVQTWPEILILLLISLLSWWFIFIKNKKS